MMKYRDLVLDDFQEKAVMALEEGNSVVVSAPTGSGKTLIADCMIDREIREGRKVVYTAPIKALSNQKFKEFCSLFGRHMVGIMTGDVVINSQAPLLIMTTEIYRNMLLVKDSLVKEISYVVLDEVHYINDIERGTVWEESIIFSDDHIRFLALSATIPNAEELAEWIRTIKKHHVIVVHHHHRPVPLRHMFFDVDLGLTELSNIKKIKEHDFPKYRARNQRQSRQEVGSPQHWMLVGELRKGALLPCIYFVFSRHEAQQKASWLSKKNDFADERARAEIAKQVREYFSRIDPQINQLASTQLLRQCLGRGIAFHHAGLLPHHKEIVEQLFGQGLIKVLYATETFAVGINMPAKTVCFDSLEKYDGRSFRYLNSKEYFQLAGRAGRRGIDKEGLAVSLINRRTANLNRIEEFTRADTLPIISQFKLSFNTVLNLVGHFKVDQIDILLKSNLGFFQAKGRAGFEDPHSVAAIKRSFIKKRKLLERLGFLDEYGLTDKGRFATHIYSNEIVLTEIFFTDVHKSLDEFQILLLLAALVYEPKRADKFERGQKLKKVDELLSLIRINPEISTRVDPDRVKLMVSIVWNWYDQCQFLDLLKCTSLLEGDVIRLFRQIIDTLNQIRKASPDIDLRRKVDACVKMVDREFIAVSFD